MTNYAVFLQGSDFELSRGGKKEALGFFITVRVDAQTEEEAASAAIGVVKSDHQLEEAFRAEATKVPIIEVKVIHELPPENMMKNIEFVFFTMEEE
ncbi:MAG: hypothetical protein R8K20_08170 [Gallionellaceae bacterium]